MIPEEAAGSIPARRVPSAGRCVSSTGVPGLSVFQFPAAGSRDPSQRYGLLAHSLGIQDLLGPHLIPSHLGNVEIVPGLPNLYSQPK